MFHIPWLCWRDRNCPFTDTRPLQRRAGVGKKSPCYCPSRWAWLRHVLRTRRLRSPRQSYGCPYRLPVRDGWPRLSSTSTFVFRTVSRTVSVWRSVSLRRLAGFNASRRRRWILSCCWADERRWRTITRNVPNGDSLLRLLWFVRYHRCTVSR